MLLLIIGTAFVLSGLLTALVRRYALAAQLLDHPNARSSHSVPTPRGGGLAIVVVSITGGMALTLLGLTDVHLFLAIAGGGSLVALVGWVDDRRSLSVRVRMLAHLCAGAWAMYLLGGLPDIRLGEAVVHLGAAGYVIGTIGLVWILNLFNFMDGIDGIAAAEAVFVSWGGALLLLLGVGPTNLTAFAVLLGAACCGFLLWNWPPAKIFMGDVGSGYLGYAIGVLAFAAARTGSGSLWPWLILGGCFLVDATVTLVHRMLRGEQIHMAHRSHAYQRLARKCDSHMKVTVAMTFINLAWLLPWALLTTLKPNRAVWMTAIALIPLVVGVVRVGAGRAEADPQT